MHKCGLFTHLQAMPDPLPRDELLMVVEAFPEIGSIAKNLLDGDILPTGATDPGVGVGAVGYVGRLHHPPASRGEASPNTQL